MHQAQHDSGGEERRSNLLMPVKTVIQTPPGPNYCPGAASSATGSAAGLKKAPTPTAAERKNKRARAHLICCTPRPSQRPPLRVRHLPKTLSLMAIYQHRYLWHWLVVWFNPQIHTGHLRVRSISYLPKCSIIHQASFSWAPLHQACRLCLVSSALLSYLTWGDPFYSQIHAHESALVT